MPCLNRNNAYSDQYGNVKLAQMNPGAVYGVPYAVDGTTYSLMNIVLFMIALFILVQLVLMLSKR